MASVINVTVAAEIEKDVLFFSFYLRAFQYTAQFPGTAPIEHEQPKEIRIPV